MKRLRLGTRGSALALAQSRWVCAQLERRHKGLKVELVVIKTTGDRMSEGATLGPAADSNVKAMFVKEIEEALLKGEVDFAVHSAKDLPADLPEGLRVAAYPGREDPRDAFVGPGSFSRLPSGACLATASLRRQIQLRLARPDLQFMALHGNVDTRLKKVKEGASYGLVLAAAGLKRLGRDVPYEPLEPVVIIPAPGQGALALEARRDRGEVLDLLAAIADAKAQAEVELERSFLRAMGGGCSTPLGALARLEGGSITLTVFWSDADGSHPVRASGKSGVRPEEMSSLVETLSAQLGVLPPARS